MQTYNGMYVFENEEYSNNISFTETFKAFGYITAHGRKSLGLLMMFENFKSKENYICLCSALEDAYYRR